MRTSVLFNVPIEVLEHHPDNPRKDLGDLEELTESIKEQGILQNLSIVPAKWEEFWGDYAAGADGEELEEQIARREDKFYVLIGNRRFEASKAAGLSSVPARILIGLSDAEQLGIMLAENLQRNDLTLPEEIYGFQRMIDLGESAESVSDKTGFSKATVYHRLNIAKLDKDVVTDAIENKQISLTDFIELEKISDIEKRNEILKNNADIKWAVKREVEEEKKREWRNNLISEIRKDFVLEVFPSNAQTWRSEWHYVKTFQFNEEADLSDLPKENLFYSDTYNGLSIYYHKEEEEVETEEDIARKKRSEEFDILADLQEDFKETIEDFLQYIIREDYGRNDRYTPFCAIWKFCLDYELEVDFFTDTLVDFAERIYWVDDITKEKDEDRLKEIVSNWRRDFQAAVLVYDYMKTYGNFIYRWGSGYDKERAGKWQSFVKILEDCYDFTLDKKFEGLLYGTHELYREEES